MLKKFTLFIFLLIINKASFCQNEFREGLEEAINGNYTEALKLYQIALVTNPKSSTIYAERSYSKKKLGDLAGAYSDLKKSLWLDSTNYDAYFKLGNLYYEEKKYKKAINSYTKAINFRNNEASYYFNRGKTLFLTGDYKSAIDDYNTCIKIDEKHLYARKSRALIHYRNKNYEAAIIDYDIALSINKYDPSSWHYLGRCHEESSNFTQALSSFENAIALNGGLPKTLLHQAICLYETKEFKRAIATCNKLLQKDPRNSNALYYRGLSKVAMDDKRSAKDDFKEAQLLGNKEAGKALANL